MVTLSCRPYPVLPLTRMVPVRWIYSCCFFPAVSDANGASRRQRRIKASWLNKLTPDAFFLSAKWQRNATEAGAGPSWSVTRVLWKGHRLHLIYPGVPSVGWEFVGVLLVQSGGLRVRQEACSGLLTSLLPLLFLSSHTSSSPVTISLSPWFPLIWFHVLLPPHASFALLWISSLAYFARSLPPAAFLHLPLSLMAFEAN